MDQLTVAINIEAVQEQHRDAYRWRCIYNASKLTNGTIVEKAVEGLAPAEHPCKLFGDSEVSWDVVGENMSTTREFSRALRVCTGGTVDGRYFW